MFLFELFDEEGGTIDLLRSQVMDYITPLAAKGVEYISIEDIATFLREARSGLMIDRGLVMRLIDPNTCKLVKEVQGDKVYLALPLDDMSAKTQDDEEKSRQKIANTASQAAKAAVQKK